MKDISFDETYEQIFPSVYRYVYMRVPKTDIEDVTAEIMAKIWRSIDSFEGRSTLKCWALRVAANYIADYYRKNKNKKTFSLAEELKEMKSGRDYGDELAITLSVGNTLAKLSESQVEVIQLRLIEGFSSSETASMLGTTQQAVDSLLYRAKKSFRTIYTSEIAGGEC